jgi:hypothetical protein
MEGEEFDALVADVKANGVLHNIVLFEDMILDGRNRYRAALKAGVRDLPFANVGHWASLPPEEASKLAINHVISANIHRRHLTAEQKRDLIAKLLKADPEKSDRAIGRMIKADKNTVASVRAKEEARGEIHHVTTRKDTKGRKQPAKKVYRQSTKAECRHSEPEDQYVVDPATMRTNVLHTIDRHRAGAKALRKIFKLSRFTDETRDEIIAAIHQLMSTWKSVEATLEKAPMGGDAIKDKPSEGNGVDPEQAAEFRKQEFAVMETGAVAVTKHDNSDGLDIPEYLRRVAS